MKDVREAVSDLVGAGLLAAMERSGVVVIWRAGA
jgi:DNA-binding GntR family transcriptional regulator